MPPVKSNNTNTDKKRPPLLRTYISKHERNRRLSNKTKEEPARKIELIDLTADEGKDEDDDVVFLSSSTMHARFRRYYDTHFFGPFPNTNDIDTESDDYDEYEEIVEESSAKLVQTVEIQPEQPEPHQQAAEQQQALRKKVSFSDEVNVREFEKQSIWNSPVTAMKRQLKP